MKGAAERIAAARSHERFRITSYLQLFREAESLPPSRDIASTALILLFREEVFSSRHPRRRSAIIRPALQGDSNEVERANILAPGFRVPQIAGCILLPAFTSELFGDWPWEVVSSYSSATAPESHGNSSHRFH